MLNQELIQNANNLHTKCFKLEVKNCAIVDTKKGTKHGIQKDIKLGKNKDT